MEEMSKMDGGSHLPIAYLELYPYPAFIFSTSQLDLPAGADSYPADFATSPGSSSKNRPPPIEIPGLPIQWQNSRWAQDYGPPGSTFEDSLDVAQIASVKSWLGEGTELESQGTPGMTPRPGQGFGNGIGMGLGGGGAGGAGMGGEGVFENSESRTEGRTSVSTQSTRGPTMMGLTEAMMSEGISPGATSPNPTIQPSNAPRTLLGRPSYEPIRSAARSHLGSHLGGSQRQSFASSGGDFSWVGGAISASYPPGGFVTTTSLSGTTLTLLVEVSNRSLFVDLVKTPCGSASTVVVQSFIRDAHQTNNSQGSHQGFNASKTFSRRNPRQRILDSYAITQVSPFQDPGRRHLDHQTQLVSSQFERSRSSAGTISSLPFELADDDVTPVREEPEDLEEQGNNTQSSSPGEVNDGLSPLVGENRRRSIMSGLGHMEIDKRSRRSGGGRSVHSISTATSAHKGKKSNVSAIIGSEAGASGSAGGSEGRPVRDLLGSTDWSKTPLGKRESWPDWLAALVGMVMASNNESCLWVGKTDLIMIFNEAYSKMAPFGSDSFGKKAIDCWTPALYAGLESLFKSMEGQHVVARDNDLWLLPDAQKHFTELETFHSFKMISVIVHGKVVAYYNSSTETTKAVLEARRASLLREITSTTALSRNRREFWGGVHDAIDSAEAARDIPYLIAYSVDIEGDLEDFNGLSTNMSAHQAQATLRLQQTVAVPMPLESVPQEKNLKLSRRAMRKMGLGLEAAAASKLLASPTMSASSAGSLPHTSHLSPLVGASERQVDPISDWDSSLVEALTTGRVVHVADASKMVEGYALRCWEELPKQALVIPIIPKGSRMPTGVMIVGVNLRRPWDDEYRSWIELMRSNLSSSLAAVTFLEVIAEQRESALALSKAQQNFFSSSAHEIKSPLTLISAPISDLSRHVTTKEGKMLLGLAQKNVGRLSRLVGALLEASRLDAGAVKGRFRMANLGYLTQEVVEVFKTVPAIQAGRIQLLTDIDSATPDPPVFVDVDMWEKLITNLLSNAVKYTRSGHILVSLEYTEMQAVCKCIDTGIGIPMADQPYISHDRFYRASNAEGTSEGTGIGLSYCSELIKLHGGALSIESQTAEESTDGGHGTIITVILPLGSDHLPSDALSFDTDVECEGKYARAIIEDQANGWQTQSSDYEASTDAASAASDAGGGGASSDSRGLDPSTLFFDKASDVILVVDDNSDMRRYICSLFTAYVTVLEARDGAEALELARKHYPTLILSDSDMPRLSGTELLKALRAESSELAYVPFILITAAGGADARADGLLSGATEYLEKPFKSRELIARVNIQVQIGKKRKALELAFEQRSTELELVSKYSPVGIVKADAEGTLTWVNEAWFDHSGYEPRTLPIGDWGPFIVPEDLSKLVSDWIGFVQNPEAKEVSMQWRWLRTGRWVESKFSRLSQHGRNMPGFIGCVIDITWQKDKEAEQQRQLVEEQQRRQEAVAARQQQEMLIDVTSHEIRTPCSAIIQCSLVVSEDLQELLKAFRRHVDGSAVFAPRGEDVVMLEEAIDSMDSIYQCGLSQSRIADDVLSLGRIQLNLLQISPVEMSIESTVKKTLAVFAIEMRKAGIALFVDFGQGAKDHPMIRSDPERLSQLIRNLMSNAIRFTASSPRKEISVSIDISTQPPLAESCLKPDMPSMSRTPAGVPIWLYAAVKDTGPGLSPVHLERLFKRFSQASQETHTVFGGSGLGLFVCRKLTELQNGKIEVSSKEGVGSEFRFVIEARTSEPSTPAVTADKSLAAPLTANGFNTSLRRLQILVVEDNLISQAVLRKQLNKAGHSVSVASDGEEALSLLKANNHSNFDFCLMDLMMPKMGGMEAITLLREAERDLGLYHLPVVALTGNARDSQRQAALEAGFDRCVIKPYKLDEILSLATQLARIR